MRYVILAAPVHLTDRRIYMIQHPSLNHENDLLKQMISTFEEYQKEVNEYTLKTLGEYACNIAEYVADGFRMVLREKYEAICKLTQNEKIHRIITKCTKAEYEITYRYLNDFIEQHEIVQNIVVRDNRQRSLLSVTKDKTYELFKNEILGHAVLCPASNNKQVAETGCIAYFIFELKNQKGKIGTMSVGISSDMFRNAVKRAAERIPSFYSMYLVSGKDNVLYPTQYHKKCIAQMLCNFSENEKGYYVSDAKFGHVTGYAKMLTLPFPVICPLSVLCELKVTN